MTNITYTREQWERAREWAKSTSGTDSESLVGTLVDIVLGLPEPSLMLEDIPVYEWSQYIGCAVDADGQYGWLSYLDKSSPHALFVGKFGLYEDSISESTTELLLNEPRLNIPGVNLKTVRPK